MINLKSSELTTRPIPVRFKFSNFPIKFDLVYSRELFIHRATITHGQLFRTYALQHSNIAINDALRLIFGHNHLESIRTIREAFGYKSVTVLFAKARNRFSKSLPHHQDTVISHLTRNLSFIENE